jgi:dienelactone hydrolase
MKKLILITLSIILVPMFIFSETYTYYVYQNNVEMGNISVEFDPHSYIGKTTTVLQVGTNTVKYVAETKYDNTWSFKEYNLDIYVDNQKQVSFKSSYDGQKIKNNFNGIALKTYEVKDAIILDNNLILDHIFAIYYKQLTGGTYTSFVPQLVLNQLTWDYAVLNIEIKYTDSENFVISSPGIDQKVTFKGDKLTRLEIPSQLIEVTEIKKEVKEKSYIEKEITFPSFDGFELNGSLMLPKELINDTKTPAIVLVHGSGANDRNETIGIIAPFLQLSEGLVNNGYIVLKYDKRNFTMMKNNQDTSNIMPIDFIKDAQAAIKYLKTIPEVDSDKIIVIGHSEGASFLPYIVKDEKVAAAVALSPGLIEITDLMVYQIEYQINYLKKFNVDNSQNATIALLENLLVQLKEINNDMKNGKIDPDKVYLDYYKGSYLIQWSELTKNTVEEFINMKVPLLIINGTQDLKTPYELLTEKENQLKQKKDLEIVYIENMGHELYRSDTGVFEDTLIDQIVNWLKKVL